MNIKPLPTLGSVIALVVFGVGLAAGMWLLPEAASSSNSQSYSVSGARSGLRSTKSGQRNHDGREVVTLSHIKHRLSGPFSGGFLMTTSSELCAVRGKLTRDRNGFVTTLKNMTMSLIAPIPSLRKGSQ